MPFDVFEDPTVVVVVASVGTGADGGCMTMALCLISETSVV